MTWCFTSALQFAVLYEARSNTGIDRMKIINSVAKSVTGPHKVDLSNPDMTIVVQIVKVKPNFSSINLPDFKVFFSPFFPLWQNLTYLLSLYSDRLCAWLVSLRSIRSWPSTTWGSLHHHQNEKHLKFLLGSRVLRGEREGAVIKIGLRLVYFYYINCCFPKS